jgi:hypothetical protein
MSKKLQFNDHVQILLIPYEDRKGIWMEYAIDRAHFKRRIQQTENVLLPVLCQKLKRCTLNSQIIRRVSQEGSLQSRG